MNSKTQDAVPPDDPYRWRRIANILLLSLAWCLAVSALFIQVSTSALVASSIASPTASTGPLAAFIIASACSAMPGTLAMARVGRRPVFLASSALALVGAGLQVLAVYRALYWLLVLGALIQGPGYSVSNNFRFAAAEFAEKPAWKPRAISAVVLGGVVAAGVGPEAARHARDWLSVQYAGCYVVMCILWAAHLAVLAMFDYRLLAQLSGGGGGQAAAGAKQRPSGLLRGSSKHFVRAPSSSGLARNISLATKPATSGWLQGLAGGGGRRAREPGAAAAAADDSREAAALQALAGSRDEAPEVSAVPTEQAGPAPADADAACHASPPAAAAAAAAAAPLVPPAAPPTLPRLLLSWRFLLPAVSGGLSFMSMVALMAGTPQEMIGDGHTYNQNVFVIEVHIVAMYLPGLLTADIITLIGPVLTLLAGCVVLLVGNGVFYAGGDLWVFFAGMTLIGVGWNWAYTAASVLVVKVYDQAHARRFVVQGATDTTVLSLSGIATGTTGTLVAAMGWQPAFVSLYMGINGLLAACTLAYWLLERRALARQQGEAAAAKGGSPA